MAEKPPRKRCWACFTEIVSDAHGPALLWQCANGGDFLDRDPVKQEDMPLCCCCMSRLWSWFRWNDQACVACRARHASKHKSEESKGALARLRGLNLGDLATDGQAARSSEEEVNLSGLETVHAGSPDISAASASGLGDESRRLFRDSLHSLLDLTDTRVGAARCDLLLARDAELCRSDELLAFVLAQRKEAGFDCEPPRQHSQQDTPPPAAAYLTLERAKGEEVEQEKRAPEPPGARLEEAISCSNEIETAVADCREARSDIRVALACLSAIQDRIAVAEARGRARDPDKTVSTFDEVISKEEPQSDSLCSGTLERNVTEHGAAEPQHSSPSTSPAAPSTPLKLDRSQQPTPDTLSISSISSIFTESGRRNVEAALHHERIITLGQKAHDMVQQQGALLEEAARQISEETARREAAERRAVGAEEREARALVALRWYEAELRRIRRRSQLCA